MEANFSFDSAEFAVADAEKRTVKVLAVPYGQPSEVREAGRFVFSKGSITIPQPISKVKLLRHHDPEQSVGYATSIEETDDGLVMTFKIASGPAGDEALAGFVDGNYDAASVGVAEIEGKKDKRGFFHVIKSRLKEVSQVAIPAFENAGLISVTASSEGENMTELDPAATPAEKTYTMEEIKNFLGFTKETKVPASIQEDENVAPATLKANAQEKKVEFVREAAPYRFDGHDSHEFSTDVFAVLKGEADDSAHKRVNAWSEATFAVATTNVTEANVTQNRPDLYVDERNYRYPIWTTLYKGVPDNGVQPFTVPKYNSSSGLVADHTEGTEPSLGAFDLTNQTVTPTAVSGKIEINREAWDMGGNPSVSRLVRDLMTKRYFEALEAYAVTYLDSLTLTGLETTLTTAGTDAQIVDGLEGAIADLTVARGGESLTELLLHLSLYKKLVLAKDSSGRRLIPRLGATNANGTVGSRLASLDIDGLVGRPAWGFGTTEDTSSHNSYLLDPNAVWAWATTPRFMEFDIQVKSVYIGLWGYKAIAALDTAGIRRIKYDTTS